MKSFLLFGLVALMAFIEMGCSGSRARTRGKFCEENNNHIPLEKTKGKKSKKANKKITIWNIDDEDFEHHEGEFEFNGVQAYYEHPETEVRIMVGFSKAKIKKKDTDPDFKFSRFCVGGLNSKTIEEVLPIEFEVPFVSSYTVSGNQKYTVKTRVMTVSLAMRENPKEAMLQGFLSDPSDGVDGSLKKAYNDDDHLDLPENMIKLFRTNPNKCNTNFETRAHLGMLVPSRRSNFDTVADLRVAALYIGPDRPARDEQGNFVLKDKKGKLLLDCEGKDDPKKQGETKEAEAKEGDNASEGGEKV